MHARDIASFVTRVTGMLREQKSLTDYDISGVTINDLDVEGVQITGSNLCGVRFERVAMKKAVFHLVFCDSAAFLGCDFSASTIQNSVFAGSLIENCRFSDCELLQCNFMGVRCRTTVYDHSNLYASRFIASSFVDVGMKDCNLTRVRFDGSVSGIDFRSSNTNEAAFGQEVR